MKITKEKMEEAREKYLKTLAEINSRCIRSVQDAYDRLLNILMAKDEYIQELENIIKSIDNI